MFSTNPVECSHRHPQTSVRGGTCLPLENVQGYIRFSYNILIGMKRTKVIGTRQASPAHSIGRPKLRLRPGLCPRPQRSRSHTQFLVVFKGSTSQQRRKDRVDRGGEEWRDGRRDGEEGRSQTVDFASSCKNSCGCGRL